MRVRVPKILRRLRRNTDGDSAIELALILPVLSGLLCGSMDMGHLMLLTQRVQNGAFILADLSGRDQTLCEDQITDIFHAMDDLLKPFSFDEDGMAIITSVSGITPTAGGVESQINWQRTGGKSLAAESNVGTKVGGEATLPASLPLAPGDPLMVAEMFYSYEPLIGMFTSPTIIHKIAYIKPRLGSLTTLPPCP